MIGHYAERTPDAPALRYAREGVAMTMTYGELRAEILKEIDYTRSLGVEAACHGFLLGDSVSPAELVGLFAAVEMGEQVVMLDANTPVPILRGLLPYTDVDTITADNELSKELKPNLCQPKIKNGAGKVAAVMFAAMLCGSDCAASAQDSSVGNLSPLSRISSG